MTDGKTTKWKKNGKTNTVNLIFSYTIHFDTVYTVYIREYAEQTVTERTDVYSVVEIPRYLFKLSSG